MGAGGASVLQMDHPLKLGTLAKSLISCADCGPWAVRSSTELLALIDQLLRSLLAGLPEVRGVRYVNGGWGLGVVGCRRKGIAGAA